MAKSFSSRVMRPEDWTKIKHFTPEEFKQPLFMGYEFMQWLDAVREGAGVVMLISSSYRTVKHNTTVGGATDSAHTEIPCDAVDIRKNPQTKVTWNHDRFQIVFTAMRLGCRRIGIYQDESIHLDMTHSQRAAPRLWIRVD